MYDLRTPVFTELFRTVLVTTRRYLWVPHSWCHSKCFTLHKHNGLHGAAAFRVLHCFDAAGKAWHAAARRRASITHPPWAYGCVPKRNREEAVLVQQALWWTAQDTKRGSLISLYDATNAFGCVKHDAAKAAAT